MTADDAGASSEGGPVTSANGLVDGGVVWAARTVAHDSSGGQAYMAAPLPCGDAKTRPPQPQATSLIIIRVAAGFSVVVCSVTLGGCIAHQASRVKRFVAGVARLK